MRRTCSRSTIRCSPHDSPSSSTRFGPSIRVRRFPRAAPRTRERRSAPPDLETVIEAVIFDLDGVLIDSEQVWDEARRQFVTEQGGRWHNRAQRDMMGMSSIEWSRYIREELGV